MMNDWFSLKSALDSGYNALAVAYILMLVMTFWNKAFGRYTPVKYRPLVASISALLLAVASNIILGFKWYDAIAHGLLVGAAASGSWSLWGKYIAEYFKLKDHGPMDKKNDRS